MKYVVLECHPGYAVVLDEEGRFRKVANLHYEVGQCVEEVYGVEVPVPAAKRRKRTWRSYAALAACVVMLAAAAARYAVRPVAGVYMSVNPVVRVDVNRLGKAVDAVGVNADGEVLLTGYDCRGKRAETVLNDLVDRAAEQGYLTDGGQVTLRFDTQSEKWAEEHGEALQKHLQDYVAQKMAVEVLLEEDAAAQPPVSDPPPAVEDDGDDHDDDPEDDDPDDDDEWDDPEDDDHDDDDAWDEDDRDDDDDD